MRQSKSRNPKTGEKDKFAGFIYCADCGQFHYNLRSKSLKYEQESYCCSTYLKKGKDNCTGHTIRTAVLDELVFDDLTKVLSFAKNHRDTFIKLIIK